MTSRPSTAAPILAVLAVVLVALGAYVGGYFWRGNYSEDLFRLGASRCYQYHLEERLFGLGAAVEGWLRQSKVQPVSLESWRRRLIQELKNRSDSATH